jgi:RNA-directed DNA polymerase
MRKREGIEPRYQGATVRADRRLDREGQSQGAHPAKAPAHAPGSKTGARQQGRDGNAGGPMGSPTDGGRVAQPAHRQEARRPMGRRRSPDERGSGGTPRAHRGAPAVAGSTAPPATRRGGSAANTGVARRAKRARRAPQTRYPSLLHHVTGDTVRACVEALDGTKAPGVEGITNARSGQHLEANRQARHQTRHPRSYRPQPRRRVEMPKAAGTRRPLGSSGSADKRVQERTRRRLDASDEPVCLDLASGFRPGRGGHEALRQRHHEGMREPVNWGVDRERAQLFDPRPHTESRAVLAAQIAEQKVLRLLARRLQAGVQPPGGVGDDARGSPQGASVSPVSAHAVREHVLDQWVVGVVRPPCHGDGNLRRSADDALAVVETADDARRVLRVLPWRRGTLGWRRNTQKTHRVAVGNRLAWPVVGGGGRRPTVDVRGFTHDWGRSRRGKARRQRNTSKQRWRRALVERKQGLRQARRARQRPDLWPALAQKMRGHFHSCGVTDHSRALYLFEGQGHHLVFTWLTRRSQRRRFTGESFRRYVNRHPLPRPGRLVSLIPGWSRAGCRGVCGQTAGRLL